MSSPPASSPSMSSVAAAVAKHEPDSEGAFSKLLAGYAHTPKGGSRSNATTTAAMARVKRKFAELDEAKLDNLKLLSPSPPPTKKGKKAAKDESWRDLRSVNDYLGPGLDVVFCGINPGRMSATAGRHFANPGNHFWSCLHEGGFTDRRVDPSEDDIITEAYNIGITNLVDRPTREAAELTTSEMRLSAPILLQKIAKYKPKIVCFVGVGIADTISSYLAVRKGWTAGAWKKENKGGVGLIPFKLVYDEGLKVEGNREGEVRRTETLFFAVSSTSGRVVAYKKADKVKQFLAVKTLLSQIQNGTYQSGDEVTPVYMRDLESP